MDLQLKVISDRIEVLRDYLISLIYDKPLTDKTIVDCSQQLDKLLIEYERVKGKNKVA